MRKVNTLSVGPIAKMREHLFEMAPDSVLIYQDPMIGRLENEVRQLLVRVNRQVTRIELLLEDRVVQAFELSIGIGEACKLAFAAYFTIFAELCEQQTLPSAEAA